MNKFILDSPNITEGTVISLSTNVYYINDCFSSSFKYRSPTVKLQHVLGCIISPVTDNKAEKLLKTGHEMIKC
jgi:hypothetical protein